MPCPQQPPPLGLKPLALRFPPVAMSHHLPPHQAGDPHKLMPNAWCGDSPPMCVATSPCAAVGDTKCLPSVHRCAQTRVFARLQHCHLPQGLLPSSE